MKLSMKENLLKKTEFLICWVSRGFWMSLSGEVNLEQNGGKGIAMSDVGHV